jgi:UTP--glucose-1-phosphate uridylyltransferase
VKPARGLLGWKGSAAAFLLLSRPMSELAEQLAALPQAVRDRLAQRGFDEQRLHTLGACLARGEVDTGLVRGKIEPPAEGDVLELPEAGTPAYQALEARGAEALGQGQVALVVLAGGMATRMGGVVKALVEALPGRTFLDLRLAEIDTLEKRYGVAPPLWLMTSEATDQGIKAALGARRDGYQVATFSQHVSLRLTPDGKLFLDAEGRPSEHAPGHGDLPDALKQSGPSRVSSNAAGTPSCSRTSTTWGPRSIR